MFFSHNKSVNNNFSHNFLDQRTTRYIEIVLWELLKMIILISDKFYLHVNSSLLCAMCISV